MSHHTKQWCKRQIRRYKRKARKLRECNERVMVKREKLSQSVGEYLAQVTQDGKDPWLSLGQFLNDITKKTSFEALFKHEQKDLRHFKEGETNPCARMDRDVVGPEHGNYHLAFFAFAPQFEGKPHSHTVNCVSAVLQGPLQEKLYSQDEKTGDLKIVSEDLRSKGSVVADLQKTNQSKFIHSVNNPSPLNHKQGSIVYSLHVYGTCRGNLFNQYYEHPSLTDKSQSLTEQNQFSIKEKLSL